MPTATATHTSSGIVLARADSADYHTVEGNIYFPAASLLVKPAENSSSAKQNHLTSSNTHYQCPWKGQSHYYDLVLEDGSKVKDIGWYYPSPKAKAEHIRDAVAWDKGKVSVKVE